MLSLIACQQQSFLQPEGSEAQGEVEIALSTTARTQLTKATTEDLPDVADFTVDILTSDGSESLYENTYSKMAGKTLYLNTGDYQLYAWCGDSLGVGFDAAFFAATEPFTVEWQEKTEISAVAKLANVKVAVVFGENLQTDYSEEGYYAIVRARQDKSLQIKYAQDETRAGYFPKGNLTFELYVVINGALKYFQYDAGDFDPNDFVTFKVDTDHGDGYVSLDITIDKETELVEESVEVPNTMLPKDAPSISYDGFDDGNAAYVIEQVESDIDMLKANLVAYGEFASIKVSTESDCLEEAGFPTEFDLLDLDDETAATLKDFGIKWLFPDECVFGYVDLAGIAPYFYYEHYDAADPTVATITITVTDKLGKETSSDCYIKSALPEVEVTIEDYDIWGWKFAAETVNCIKANADLVGLQYQDNDGDWHDVELTGVGTSAATFGEITGLTAGTTYTLRTTYAGDPTVSTEFYFDTEDPQQPANCDFESWTTGSRYITVEGGTNYNQDYWNPYLEDDPWWATNSAESVTTTITALTNGHWMKCFPCAGPSVDTPDDSAYSAEMISVYVGNSSTTGSKFGGKTHIGYMFIGTVDSTGEVETTGHTFSSRPSGITFDYKYSPYHASSDNFCVEVDVYADESAETLIGSYSTIEGPSASNWSVFEAGVDYTVTDQKAAWICITIRSAYESSGVGTGESVEFNGESLKAHAGCYLWVDNVRLIYE